MRYDANRAPGGGTGRRILKHQCRSGVYFGKLKMSSDPSVPSRSGRIHVVEYQFKGFFHVKSIVTRGIGQIREAGRGVHM